MKKVKIVLFVSLLALIVLAVLFFKDSFGNEEEPVSLREQYQREYDMNHS